MSHCGRVGIWLVVLLASSTEAFTPRSLLTPPPFSLLTTQRSSRLLPLLVSQEERITEDTSVKKPRHRKRAVVKRITSLPNQAVRIYANYASRLWTETNPEARGKIAKRKAELAIRHVQTVIRDDEYKQFSDVSDEARQQLLDACDGLLIAMGNKKEGPVNGIEKETTAVAKVGEDTDKPKKKKSRSVLFGALMGLAVACWVFSGNYIFTGLFTLMTILGQLEYYRMVQNTGVYPARRISIIGACSMFLTALFTPNLHQICLPIFGLWAMVWFLTMKRGATTIPEIATTFTGMFYLGYVPSFWVRIRLLGSLQPTRLAPIAKPVLEFLSRNANARLPSYIPKVIQLPITTGAVFIFWSWLSLAFSDVGAYFVGRRYGKHKLAEVSAAAGATSPNKTVEGVLGGCAVSAGLAMFGTYSALVSSALFLQPFAHRLNLNVYRRLGPTLAILDCDWCNSWYHVGSTWSLW